MTPATAVIPTLNNGLFRYGTPHQRSLRYFICCSATVYSTIILNACIGGLYCCGLLSGCLGVAKSLGSSCGVRFVFEYEAHVRTACCHLVNVVRSPWLLFLLTS